MAKQSLFCERGQHWWSRESQRGRRPHSCPEHRPITVEIGIAVDTHDSRLDDVPRLVKRSRLPVDIVTAFVLEDLPVPDLEQVDHFGYSMKQDKAIAKHRPKSNS